MQRSASRRILVENIFSLAALQMINYLAPLITVPFLARVLLPAHFGLLAYAQSIVLYFDLLTDFGFNFSATRAISVHRHDPQIVARVFWSTMASKLLLMLVSILALCVLIAFIPELRRIRELLTVNCLYLIGSTLFPVWYFQGLERIKVAAACSGIGRLLTVPALLLLVHSPGDYLQAGAIQASVEFTASLIAIPYIASHIPVRGYRPTQRDIKATLREGWPLFLSASALQISGSSTTIIVAATSGVLEVGYFSAADKIIRTATAVLSPIGLALYPRISAVKHLSGRTAFALIRKSLRLNAVIGLCVSAAILVGAHPFCDLILGKSFTHSAAILEWLAPLPFLYGAMSVLGTQTMLVFGMDVLFSRVMIISVALSVPATFWLASRAGAAGAAVATDLLALGIVISLALILVSKRMPVWKSSVAEDAPSAEPIAR